MAFDQCRREVLKEVLSMPANPLVQLGYCQTLLLIVLGLFKRAPFFFSPAHSARQHSLGTGQLLLGFSIELGVVYYFSCGYRQEVFDVEVDSNLTLGLRKAFGKSKVASQLH